MSLTLKKLSINDLNPVVLYSVRVVLESRRSCLCKCSLIVCQVTTNLFDVWPGEFWHDPLSTVLIRIEYLQNLYMARENFSSLVNLAVNVANNCS